METMWTFKTKNFEVRASIEPCDSSLDLSWDETGETRANLESGLWTAFDTRVEVFFRGRVIGSDTLGESIYERPADFFKEHRGMNARGHGSYFSDMVREAVRHARSVFAEQGQVKLRAA
jgi:hypothetical protein